MFDDGINTIMTSAIPHKKLNTESKQTSVLADFILLTETDAT